MSAAHNWAEEAAFAKNESEIVAEARRAKFAAVAGGAATQNSFEAEEGQQSTELYTYVDSSEPLPDSVQLFLLDAQRTARRYPLLSAQREKELARQIERGNLEAKEELTLSNLRYAIHVAKRYFYKNGHLKPGDVLSEAMLGLARAAETFDYRKNCRFTTHADYQIKHHITRAFENKERAIRLPVSQVRLLRKAQKVERALAAQKGGSVTLKEVADEAGIAASELWRYERASSVASLDQEIEYQGSVRQTGGLTTLGHTAVLASQEEIPNTDGDNVLFWEQEISNEMSAALASLTDAHRRVLQVRVIDQDTSADAKAKLAKELGVPHNRIPALHAEALALLANDPRLVHLYN